MHAVCECVCVCVGAFSCVGGFVFGGREREETLQQFYDSNRMLNLG